MDYTVLSKPTCPYSQAAIKFFKDRNIKVNLYQVDTNDQENDFSDQDFKRKYGKKATYPRIYKKNKFIGGYNDLEKYFN